MIIVKECQNPELLKESHVRIMNESGQQVSVYNTVLTFACENGYETVDKLQTRCQANKTWDQNVPTCIGTL